MGRGTNALMTNWYSRTPSSAGTSCSRLLPAYGCGSCCPGCQPGCGVRTSRTPTPGAGSLWPRAGARYQRSSRLSAPRFSRTWVKRTAALEVVEGRTSMWYLAPAQHK
jgi:hypothetical protein